MIRSLNEDVKASDVVPNTSYEPIPKGDYDLRLVSVSDWKPTVLTNVKVITYTDDFRKAVGADGKDITTIVPSLTIYSANLKFEVVGGDYNGRWIYSNVTTHPNIPWSVPSLLSGLGVPTLKLSQLSTLVDTMCNAKIDIEINTRKIVDKDTGIESLEAKPRNVIKRFNKKEEEDLNDII